MRLYGDSYLDLYGEEHAVICSPDNQIHRDGDSKNNRTTLIDGICNPNIPIKAPQVSDYLSCIACCKLLPLLQFIASQNYSFSGRKSTNLVNNTTIRLQDNSLQEMKDEGVVCT